MEEKILELRMYFFVPQNVSEIYKGIQAGHAALRYAVKFHNSELMDFVDNHETWVILNGGTTNDDRDFDGISKGSLNQIADSLQDNDIDFTYFHEPDLNNALTAVCFICDERVFNRKDYPDFVDWILNVKMFSDAKDMALKNNPEFWTKLKIMPNEEVIDGFPEYYKEWVRFIGGVKNVFLRELIKDKKKA